MREAAARSDVEDYLRHDKAFDDVVSEAACNPFATKALVAACRPRAGAFGTGISAKRTSIRRPGATWR